MDLEGGAHDEEKVRGREGGKGGGGETEREREPLLFFTVEFEVLFSLVVMLSPLVFAQFSAIFPYSLPFSPPHPHPVGV